MGKPWTLEKEEKAEETWPSLCEKNPHKRPDIYAHNLYNHLRTLDRAGCVRIFVQSLPQDERWVAILDRLQRASGMGDDSLELSVS